MIITDDTPQSPTSPDKASASTPLLSGASGSGAPPPAYVPRETGPTPIGTVYQPVYGQRRESAARRFCLAFLIAFGIWILASALLGSIVDRTAFEHGTYPTYPGVSTETCVSTWRTGVGGTQGSFPYSAGITLDVPLPDETLLFLSQGSLSAGNLRITTSSEISGIARVHITVHYYRENVRDSAKICSIDRKSGERGVGIFTPMWSSPSATDRLYFDVVLTLPRGNPLYINRLATDVNNFSHDLDALKDIVNFGEISLKGTNGQIFTGSLGAAVATLTTTNAPVKADYLATQSTTVRTSNDAISGNYYAVDLVDLRTSNGPVNVFVDLDSSDSKATKKVTMRTSNDVLASTINLGTPSGSGGKFHVDAETSNGLLATTIASSPLDAVLYVQAKTSNSPASLTLPPTYEGDFDVRSSNSAPPALKRLNPLEKDPASKGRTRAVGTNVMTKRTMSGTVYWTKANRHRGTVKLETSNAPVTLYV
ncbi:hypothetical protein DFH07DRAFT_550660 [Mycena maculata]|uniref:Uncharacterized protein n=1 Tax=Mycena maculata TaxID=230809 RepID=A0AAD7ITC4_9AGAR|nr:hypothetical protein DFH07DRAFT_550660 [Mycena maculata]